MALNMTAKNIIFIALFSILMGPAYAGIKLNKTRVIFYEKKNQANVTFVNTDKDNYLVEAAVIDTKTGKISDSFMVIPPIFRSEGGKSNVLKIIKRKKEEVSDRESDYKLVLNAIPASERGTNEKTAKISFSLGFAIKLFYRPMSLKSSSSDAYKYLTFHKKDGVVIARNNSEYNISLSQLILGRQRINLNTQPSMIRPFSSVIFKSTEVASEARWRLIDDFGGQSKEYRTKIH